MLGTQGNYDGRIAQRRREKHFRGLFMIAAGRYKKKKKPARKPVWGKIDGPVDG